jgi:hypothetical protein
MSIEQMSGEMARFTRNARNVSVVAPLGFEPKTNGLKARHGYRFIDLSGLTTPIISPVSRFNRFTTYTGSAASFAAPSRICSAPGAGTGGPSVTLYALLIRLKGRKHRHHRHAQKNATKIRMIRVTMPSSHHRHTSSQHRYVARQSTGFQKMTRLLEFMVFPCYHVCGQVKRAMRKPPSIPYRGW